MSNYKKVVAALTAIMSMASLGAGTISASAADLDAINEKILNDTASDEEKFVAEYANDSEEMKVADYVINSDISLCDAESLMSSYEIGLANADFTETFSGNDTIINMNRVFYSDSNLSKNQHYFVLIAHDGTADVDALGEIRYNNSNISFGENPVARVFNQGYNVILNKKNSNAVNYLKMTANICQTTQERIPTGVFDTPFEILPAASNNGVSTELKLHNQINFKCNFTDSNNGNDTQLSFETYARGDFNHDGKLTEDDVTYVMKILVGTYSDIVFHFNDKDNNTSKIVTYLAADADRDNDLTVADAVWMNKNRD